MTWLDLQALKLRIERLGPTEFAELCNRVLTMELGRYGIGATALNSTVRVTLPDGGIDARCTGVGAAQGRLFPGAEVAYQYKSGMTQRSAAQIARADILGKPGVRAALEAGECFVYIAAVERETDFELEIAKEAQKKAKPAKGKNAAKPPSPIAVAAGQIVYFGLDALARIIQQHPAGLARLLQLSEAPMDVEEWSQLTRLANEFKTDAKLTAQLEELRARIEAPRARVRVVGAAGVGKTRSVLETMLASSLRSSTVYAAQRDHLSKDFVQLLRQPGVTSCVVVVDEVDDIGWADLKDAFDRLPDDVRLVSIGVKRAIAVASDVLQLEGLSQAVLSEIVESVAPGVPSDVANNIAASCERSPKLAVLLADGVGRDTDLVIRARQLKDGDIREGLGLILAKLKGVKFLRAVSVLDHVGWMREVSSESEMLFEALGIDPVEGRAEVEQLHERSGILPLAGDYRYVSPTVLADYAAALEIRTWTRTQVAKFVDAISPSMNTAFTRRVRQIADVLPDATAVEEVLLGPESPFQSLAEIRRVGAGRVGSVMGLLRRLAAPLPIAALAAIRRVIQGASDEDLRDATDVRRDLVWTLQDLLWRADTFPESAMLLFKLARNENETWGNNATGIWTETFQTWLGRTAADGVARLQVLRRALRGTDAAGRRLVAAAAGAVMGSEHVSRMGMPPSDVPTMPREEWRPSTWGEWIDLVVGCLAFVGPMAADDDAAVRGEAAETVAKAVPLALRLPGVVEAVTLAARRFVESDFEDRMAIASAVEDANRQLARNLEQKSKAGEEIEHLDQLTRARDELSRVRDALLGDDFSSRFRRAASRRAWRDPELAETIAALEEVLPLAIDDPQLLESEWEWLQTTSVPTYWVSVLGRLDAQRTLSPRIREIAQNNPSAEWWLPTYDIARASAAGDDEQLDRRITDLRRLGWDPDQLFAYLLHLPPSEFRVQALAELVLGGGVSPHRFRQIVYSAYSDAIGLPELIEFTSKLSTTPAGAAATIPIAVALAKHEEALSTEHREFLLRLLSVAEVQASKSRDYDWARLAMLLCEEHAEDIAELALRRMVSRRSTTVNDEAMNTLTSAWRHCDHRDLILTVFAPLIEGRDVGSFVARSAFRRLPLDPADEELLLAWVGEDPERRAYNLGNAIGSPSAEMSHLHAELLARHSEFGVGDEYLTDFMSGMWTGSEAAHLISKREIVTGWLNDPRPAASSWAKRLSDYLEARIDHASRKEEEERFRDV